MMIENNKLNVLGVDLALWEDYVIHKQGFLHVLVKLADRRFQCIEAISQETGVVSGRIIERTSQWGSQLMDCKELIDRCILYSKGVRRIIVVGGVSCHHELTFLLFLREAIRNGFLINIHTSDVEAPFDIREYLRVCEIRNEVDFRPYSASVSFTMEYKGFVKKVGKTLLNYIFLDPYDVVKFYVSNLEDWLKAIESIEYLTDNDVRAYFVVKAIGNKIRYGDMLYWLREKVEKESIRDRIGIMM